MNSVFRKRKYVSLNRVEPDKLIMIVYHSSDRNSVLFEILHKESPYQTLKSYEHYVLTAQARKQKRIGVRFLIQNPGWIHLFMYQFNEQTQFGFTESYNKCKILNFGRDWFVSKSLSLSNFLMFTWYAFLTLHAHIAHSIWP